MTAYAARVFVTLKPMVNDPQGLTVMGGLEKLGFSSVRNVRVGKLIRDRGRGGGRGGGAARG